ncbi:MAG: MerR family transcriptional regulator [Clostridiales bacterium]|jgi:DNA-binding transcriptional MerR regulator|nr:MerR family transcriptional regulator [Clostridiales bacterium]
MFYTIGEISEKLMVPASTLRYYDREGLLPFLERSRGGARIFKDEDVEWLFLINCLKQTGMSIKDIKAFTEMVKIGDETIDARLDLFIKHKAELESKLSQLQEALEVLKYKCWYYETAKNAGATEYPKKLKAEEVPEEMRKVKLKLEEMRKI